MEAKKPIIAIDFDGTIVKPGEDNYKSVDFEFMPNAKKVLKELYNKAYLILWTCRDGEILQNALNFLDENEIKFHKINENIDELNFETSDKIYADIYFDDRAREKIDWLKLKKEVEKEMKKSYIKKMADEIMHKVADQMVNEALIRHKRPTYYRMPGQKTDEKKVPGLSELQKDKNRAQEDITRLWKSQGNAVVDALKEKKKTPQLENFQDEIKKIVVKRGLPDNVDSADWLDRILKGLTKHDWLIPPASFHPRNPTTIQAFKQNEMKK